MVPLEKIQADAQFQRDCDKAAAKANKASSRVRERLEAAESKEIERHQKAMAEIQRKRRAIFQEVYSAIYDPLEVEAFTRAEARISAASNPSLPS